MNGKKRKAGREELKREIIEAALELNERKPFLEITLADIARSARFTRSNLYKYFSCREDLYLTILQQDFTQWSEELTETFFNRKFSIKEFSHIWVDLLLKRKRMVELYSLVFSHLEKKASPLALNDWNDHLSRIVFKVVDLLLEIFPGSEREDMKEFFHTHLALAVGLTPLLFLNETQVQSKAKFNMTSNRSYYREILSHAVESLLLPWV